MKTAQSININIKHECDRSIILKLQAIAPYVYDDLAGVARRFLHAKADEFIAEHGIDVNKAITQSAIG